MVTSPWRERREVWREKRKVRIFGKGKCKLIANCANFWQVKVWIHRQSRENGDVTSVSLSLYLSLSLSLSHRKYLTHNIGSASALPILCVRYFWWEREREREREIDGSDVTIVALKLAMNLYLTLPKLRTIGDELTFSLAKKAHFLFLPSHFPSLHSRRGHHCGAEIRNEFTLSIAKNFFALRLCSPSFKWHEPRDEWSKTQDKWSNLAQSYFVLPIEKLNQINTKTIGNRKRDCAWGGSGW